MLSNGNVYDKCKIIENSDKDPYDNSPVDPNIQIVDLQLRSACEDFLAQNPWAFEYNKANGGYKPKVEM